MPADSKRGQLATCALVHGGDRRSGSAPLPQRGYRADRPLEAMADDPVAEDRDTGSRRVKECELFIELCDLFARVDGIPQDVIEAARSAGPAPAHPAVHGT